MGTGKGRIDLDGTLEQTKSAFLSSGSKVVGQAIALKKQVIGAHVLRPTPKCRNLAIVPDPLGDRGDDVL